MKKLLKNYLFLFSLAGIIIFLDQWTKDLVRNNLSISEMWVPWDWLSPYARIIHWQNTGAAFGLGQNLSWVFATLAFVVVGAIIYYFPKVEQNSFLIRVALGMQLGGALGNLIDRINHDMHVTDFISIGRFAVFNVADASIFVGTIFLILGVWLDERKQKISESIEDESLVETETPINIEEFQGD